MVIVFQLQRRTISLAPFEKVVLHKLEIQVSLPLLKLNKAPSTRIRRFLYPKFFFYSDTPSVHTCPPYTLGVSGDFCIRSPEWKFLYTLCIRIRVDARIRIILYTLTSQYQNQS